MLHLQREQPFYLSATLVVEMVPITQQRKKRFTVDMEKLFFEGSNNFMKFQNNNLTLIH